MLNFDENRSGNNLYKKKDPAYEAKALINYFDARKNKFKIKQNGPIYVLVDIIISI